MIHIGFDFTLFLFDFDSFRYALLSSLPNEVMILLRNLVKLDDGQQLVFIVLEYFRAKLIAVSITHASAINTDFHCNLLPPLGGLGKNRGPLPHFPVFFRVNRLGSMREDRQKMRKSSSHHTTKGSQKSNQGIFSKC
jgi:hypothetical protein